MDCLSGIVLAAGRSTRMEEQNKLLLPFAESTVLETTVAAVAAAGLPEVIVVTGHDDRTVRDVLARFTVRVAYNPEFATGMASSLRRGILAASPDSAGFLICLADMPLIRPETYRLLAATFALQTEQVVLTTSYEGRRGHPVLFSGAFRDRLLQLRGDEGGRSILSDPATPVLEVAVADPGVLRDIDTWEGYRQLVGA